jgi:hypothetical protein
MYVGGGGTSAHRPCYFSRSVHLICQFDGSFEIEEGICYFCVISYNQKQKESIF